MSLISGHRKVFLFQHCITFSAFILLLEMLEIGGKCVATMAKLST